MLTDHTHVVNYFIGPFVGQQKNQNAFVFIKVIAKAPPFCTVAVH
jgi:hypothetical protein